LTRNDPDMRAKGKPKAHRPPGRRAVNRGKRRPSVCAPRPPAAISTPDTRHSTLGRPFTRARRPPAAWPGTGKKAPPRLQAAGCGSHSRGGLPPAGKPPGGPVTPALGRPGGPPHEPQRGLATEPAMLLVHQVARRLGVTTQHVRDFIEEGSLRAINVGKSCRKFWRIPVEAYQAFLKGRSSLD